MAFPAFLSSALIFLIFSSSVESKNLGFTVDLIHRDNSPSSPYYNPSSTPAERLSNELLRSHKRANYFQSAAAGSLPFSTIVPDGGGYLMNYTLGTPAVPILSIADTGSDLLWTQCAPCDYCYQQTAPLYDPKMSKTYEEVSCNSSQCGSVPQTKCYRTDGTLCRYYVQYGDGSYSYGIVATETLGLGSTSFEGVTFGCGDVDRGTFSTNDSGIVGLGRGPASIVSQLNSTINGKFSYCLLSEGTKGKLNFGDNAVVSGDGVVSTSIINSGRVRSTFYNLVLNGFTVGGKKINAESPSQPPESPSQSPLPSPGTSNNGINIIIDSGTTLTFLPEVLYKQLEDKVNEAVKAEPVADPQGILKLCYKTSKGLNLPGATAHFDGADVELKDYNLFIQVTEEVVCLAFSSGFDISIYGNIAQKNFLVGYDLVKNTVSFKPNGCGTD